MEDSAYPDVITKGPSKLWPYQEEAVKRMAGIGEGLSVSGKVFYRMGTALTTSPQRMHFALAGKPRDDA